MWIVRPSIAAVLLVLSVATSATPISADQAAHLVNGDEADTHVQQAVWNGQDVAFVDFARPASQPEFDELALFVVSRNVADELEKAFVTAIEHEGGPPEIAALGFANADRDREKELIVIVTWPQVHYDYGGAFYEVRFFDNLAPGRSALKPLERVSKRFAFGCECTWRDGKIEHYRFRTIAAVKKELLRLGY
jgi:hypothetical protein